MRECIVCPIGVGAMSTFNIPNMRSYVKGGKRNMTMEQEDLKLQLGDQLELTINDTPFLFQADHTVRPVLKPGEQIQLLIGGERVYNLEVGRTNHVPRLTFSHLLLEEG